MRNYYQGDPYWLTARYNSSCNGCKSRVKKGETIFYFPKPKYVYCGDCGDSWNYNRKMILLSKWTR